MPIELTINGKPRTLDTETDLLSFLDANGISSLTIAVEYNGEILKREQFGEITLRAGDRLEIVRAIGGGQPSA